MEKTLAIVKPDGVKRSLTGEILKRIEAAGLRITALKMMKLEKSESQAFYEVHAQRPFFDDLCEYMSSGPIVAVALEGEDAVKKYRDLIGATDPQNAEQGTIRADLGVSLEENTVHGSDSPETASVEISFFFNRLERVQR